MGFAWSVPVSSKENNRAKTNGGGGGKRIIGGGVQNRLWEGVLWCVFPSPEFSTPLCFSLKNIDTYTHTHHEKADEKAEVPLRKGSDPHSTPEVQSPIHWSSILSGMEIRTQRAQRGI